ncbi:haloacid dehalogenase-like hydrolase domain-containing protein 2 [Anabrus simplex]|uniref:haloacid dehalogenase-like hydrolase domain-containing protein 2 n=1 Tax=Anabrus simplex TaxID=316456 RepID=UPI0035A33F66
MKTLNLPIKAVLIDLSGTLHIDDTAIPGAVDALKRLRKTNIPVKFVTNTTKESRRFLHERLVGLGFEIKPDEIWSSLWAARDLVASRELQPYLMLEDAAMEDFADLGKQEGEHEYNSVVIGLAPSMFDYDHLNKAFRLLLRGASLIAIHEARYYKRSDGLALGPGPFVKALEYAADCKSEVVGKPSPNFFKSALGDVDPKYAIMIGDDVRDDIGGAQKLGMQGILVQTGKYRPGDEDKISPPPCKVCPSFTHAVNMLLGELQKSE